MPSTVFAAVRHQQHNRLARLLAAGARCENPFSPQSLPLGWYADNSFYVMRTDAYDRFATRLEKRFTRAEIEQMLNHAGLGEVRFSDDPQFWCALGIMSTAPRGD